MGSGDALARTRASSTTNCVWSPSSAWRAASRVLLVTNDTPPPGAGGSHTDAQRKQLCARTPPPDSVSALTPEGRVAQQKRQSFAKTWSHSFREPQFCTIWRLVHAGVPVSGEPGKSGGILIQSPTKDCYRSPGDRGKAGRGRG